MGLALGVSTTLLSAAPSGAQQASTATTVSCRVNTSGSQSTKIRTTGLPPDTSLETLLVFRSEDSSANVDGVAFYADANGVLETPWFSPGEAPYSVAWVVYRDTNRDRHWNPDEDETFYRGDGNITDCPQTVTLSSK